jgi:hypothetical protein
MGKSPAGLTHAPFTLVVTGTDPTLELIEKEHNETKM